jgi:hypothetical protein
MLLRRVSVNYLHVTTTFWLFRCLQLPTTWIFYTTADVISKLVPTGEILSAEKKISEKSKKPKFRSFDRG